MPDITMRIYINSLEKNQVLKRKALINNYVMKLKNMPM